MNKDCFQSWPLASRSSLCSVAFVLLCGSAMAQAPAAPGRSGPAIALHRAVAAAQQGDLNAALTQAQALVERYPAYAPGLKFEGAMLEEAGHAKEAEAAYEKALKLAPTDTELMFKVGVSELAEGKNAEAIALFSRKLRLEPRDPETLFYQAQAYHLLGENDNALKAIEKSEKLAPNEPAILQKYGELLGSSGNNAAALPWLVKAKQGEPKLSGIDYDLAIASYRNQDLDNAVTYAAKAVEVKPDDLRALALLAEVDVKLARWQEAKPLFEHLLRLKAGDPASLLGLGHSELALKQYQPAVDTLQQLLSQDSTTILAHFYLARAYAGLGQKAEAEHEAEVHSKLVEQAASIVPQDERDVEKATLIEARTLLANGQEAAAIQLFRKRAKGPTATAGEPYLLVGVVYLYMGRSEDAERLLLQAQTVQPDVREAHTYLGLLGLQQRNLDKAEAEFKAELAMNPNSQLAFAELGEVRYRQARWQEAADQITRSKTVNPALLYMLSDSYFHLGRVKDADLTAELAVGYAKGDSESRRRVIDLLVANGQTELAKKLTGPAAQS